MPEGKRIKKTLDRNLRDLDDHLHFLRESLSKLSNGDTSYVKPLTAELRLLVCKIGKEGLLWRVVDEIGTDDRVNVHLAGNLNRDHPLVVGLQFMFIPLLRSGLGDPRLIPGEHSLKSIIRESEALLVSGDTYTYGKLIRTVSAQMGSAHEDEGVAPFLVELSGTVISDQPALNIALISIADLVLEVGEKVLADANQKLGFCKKQRAEITVPSNPVKSYSDAHSTDFDAEKKLLPTEGTVFFMVDHPHSDWRNNGNKYGFGLFRQGQLSINAVKHDDQTMEVTAEGLRPDAISFREPIPESEQPGATIGLTWNANEVNFYLNGVRVKTTEFINKP
jgi:hypothetical protein